MKCSVCKKTTMRYIKSQACPLCVVCETKLKQ